MMGQRGRKSAAELATAPVVAITPRPSAPDHLNDAEAAVWENIVSCMASDYFRGHHIDQLANMCRHIVTARCISEWIENVLSGEQEGDVEAVERLLRMRAKETASANALARSLRLTKQAQVSPKGAAGKEAPGGNPLSDRPAPWEFK